MSEKTILKRYTVHISGMTCQSCEVRIERKLVGLEGVKKATVSHVTGTAQLICEHEPRLQDIHSLLSKEGYGVLNQNIAKKTRNTMRDYGEIGAIFLILFGITIALKKFDVIPGFGISDTMSYGLIFLIGLVAASSSCIAVSGGLLLALAGEYAKSHPFASRWERMRMHLSFNIGRIISYTLFGALIGLVGSSFTFSPKLTGVITILASAAMIILGFKLLNIFPWLSRFHVRMPKALAHKIHGAGVGAHGEGGSFLLGAATFFLPCGFTQALQLYVLSKGDLGTGALTMLVFSLGTMPALLAVGIISASVKGAAQRFFLRFSGAVVVFLGFMTFSNGFALAGTPISFDFLKNQKGDVASQEAELLDGKQVVEMKVLGYKYEPSRFTVRQGVPVEWRVDGSSASGCAQTISIPQLGISEYLPKGSVKTITFTPQEEGELQFTCSMGMTAPGTFVVRAQ